MASKTKIESGIRYANWSLNRKNKWHFVPVDDVESRVTLCGRIMRTTPQWCHGIRPDGEFCPGCVASLRMHVEIGQVPRSRMVK